MTHTAIIAHNTFKASVTAAHSALDRSPLNPLTVARAVALEAVEREKAARQAAKQSEQQPNMRTPGLLGAWINGKLRFQSRDHEAIYDYAQKHMDGAKNFGNDVWVAPVGSFVDDAIKRESMKKKLNKIHGKGAKNG